MFYLHNTPFWLRMLFPGGLTWEGKPAGKKVYLTFDDGPHPEATPFVLDQLKEYGMKGTFFCIGKNVVRYPEIFNRIIAEGHAVGNHTMHHMNGKDANVHKYVNDALQAHAHIQSSLFRPPYGELKRAQANALRRAMPVTNIVMWSVLTGDFDTGIHGEKCFHAVRKHTKPGSIIVFHDSAKAMDRLKVALPLSLAWIATQGWASAKID